MNKVQKAIQNPRKAINVIAYRLTGSKHSDFRRFIVLSRSRTGSNLLVSYLGSHPNIVVGGELFARLNGRTPETVLADVFSDQPYYVKARGFKIFYYHPIDGGDILNQLARMDVHVIHLKRRNILRTLVSRKIADAKDVWSTTSKPNEAITGSFTPDELRFLLTQTREWEAHGDLLFRNHPVLQVCYEDLVSDPIDTFRRLSDFLGVRYFQPKTPLRKQNPQPLPELLSNYDELKAAFCDTEWRSMF